MNSTLLIIETTIKGVGMLKITITLMTVLVFLLIIDVT